MNDRRKNKRVNYFASDENMQRCVMKSWKAVIKRYQLNGFKYAVTIPEKKDVPTEQRV